MVSVSNQKICEIDIRIFLPLFEMREKNSGLVFVVHLRENLKKTKKLDTNMIFQLLLKKIPSLYILYFLSEYLQLCISEIRLSACPWL